MSARRLAAALAACVLAAFAAYAPGLAGPFVYDDVEAIEVNPSIASLTPLSAPLHPPAKTALTGRPIANLSLAVSHAVNRALGVAQGPDGSARQTIAYHTGNLILHVLCGLLLMGTIRRTFALGRIPDGWRTSGDAVAMAVTAVWLLHPLQSEVILYATQRTEALASFFYLLTIYSAIRLSHSRGGRRVAWAAASLAAFALGMGTKEMVATAPLLILLYDRAFGADSWRDAFRRRWWLYAAMIAVAAAVVSAMPPDARNRTVGFTFGIPWYEYFYTQCWAVLRYLSLAIFPDRLALDYGIGPIKGLAGLPGLVLLSLAGVATVAAWTKADRWGWAGFLGAWFFVILAPSSSFVPIVTEVAAERRMHLALAAPVLAAVIGTIALRRRLEDQNSPPLERKRIWVLLAAVGVAFALSSRWTAARLDGVALQGATSLVLGAAGAAVAYAFLVAKRAGRVVTAVVLALGIGTFFRARTWADEERLWRDSMAKIPWNPRAPSNLGAIIEERSSTRRPEAALLYHEAIRRDSLFSPAWYNLAELALDEGRKEDARQLLEKAVATNPNAANGYSLLGGLAVERGEYRRAIDYLERVAGDPPSEQTLIDLSNAYWRSDRPLEATGALLRELQLFPHRTDVAVSLGKLLLARGEPEQAARFLAQAADQRPGDADALTAFATALAGLGRRDDAVALLRKVLVMSPGFAPAIEQLKKLGG